MKTIDNFLNNITMYRLVLYHLILLLIIAAVFSFFGLLPFNFFALFFSTLFLIIISWAVNTLFAKVYNVSPNTESIYISALILALVISPIKSVGDLPFLGWAAIWTVASKYIFAVKKKHPFNPVAFALVLTSLTLNNAASWWIGTLPMLPFVFVGGLLIVRKIKRADLFFSFLITSLITIFIFGFAKGLNVASLLQKVLIDSPLLFFATIMLTEPQTTPPAKKHLIIYGMITGFLITPYVHLGSLYSTPELALIAGNIYSYLVSPKIKLILKLKEKIPIGHDIYDFVFNLDKKIDYKPGQYLEWTLGHTPTDSRGNRRFFTLASSPTEDNIRIGVKFYNNSSSFKKSLLNLSSGSEITAASLSGDFILKKDPNQKYVFIAGGIGITPFRSIIKYLLDKKLKRSIILLYSNKKADEIAYSAVFDQASRELGIKTIYTLTDGSNLPSNWSGRIGRINEEMIINEIPDYKERVFYLSGPHGLVQSFEEVLAKIGVDKHQIITDYFPGF